LTWDELIERYVRELQARQRAERFYNSERYVLKAFQAFCASRKVIFVEDLRLEHLLAYAQWQEEKGMKAWTRFGRLGCVRRWLTWATRRGHLLSNPTANWQLRTPPQTFRAVPTEAEMEILLEEPPSTTTEGQRDRVLLEFLYGTGLRVLECAQAQLADLDLTHALFTVQSGKGGPSRTVPLGPRLASRMQEYLHDIRPQLARPGHSVLFVDNRGNPMRDHTITQRVSTYSHKKFCVHSLRHAYATHLLLNGAPLWAVQRLLGHQSLDSTAIYTRLLPLDVQNAVLRHHPRSKKKTHS